MTRLLLLGLMACLTLAAPADEAAELIAKGDAADAEFLAREALVHYLPAEKLRPNDAVLLVKIARQHVYRMADMGSVAAKIELGKTALNYAERAVKADPGNSDAHLSIAICLGKIVQLQGNREKVEASKRIKEAAERAVKLDPRNDYAWHLLGRWHQALAGLGGFVKGVVKLVYGELPPASNEEAAMCFKKAIALKPDRLIHHVELGRTYAQMGRVEDAKALIGKGLAMPNRDKDDPETKARGRATLEKL
jgi:tetratricopeptide (TPR) repeat protein